MLNRITVQVFLLQIEKQHLDGFVKMDLGDIIKNEISVSFGRNEDNKAADYAALAEERGFQPTQKLKVEPMTLKALVRERLEAGKEMPTEIFNVFVGNKTTIKRNTINMNQVAEKKKSALADI